MKQYSYNDPWKLETKMKKVSQLPLLRALEQAARERGIIRLTTHCSITAKKPAQRMGFVVIKEQTVQKNGVSFINYVMEKKLALL